MTSLSSNTLGFIEFDAQPARTPSSELFFRAMQAEARAKQTHKLPNSCRRRASRSWFGFASVNPWLLTPRMRTFPNIMRTSSSTHSANLWKSARSALQQDDFDSSCRSKGTELAERACGASE